MRLFYNLDQIIHSLCEQGVYRQICVFVSSFISDKNVGISRGWRSMVVALRA